MTILETRVLLAEVTLEDNEHVLDIHQRDPFKNLAVVGINATNYPKNRYELSAYPGPNVVSDQGRAEHLPPHLHVKSPNIGELKIDIETLQVIGTNEEKQRQVPKELKKHLEDNKAHYKNAIMQVYHTGRFNRDITDYKAPASLQPKT